LPGGLYSVESDGRVLHCQRAASCLLRPEIGDLVLVNGPDAKPPLSHGGGRAGRCAHTRTST
jgi:hypothetical protein